MSREPRGDWDWYYGTRKSTRQEMAMRDMKKIRETSNAPHQPVERVLTPYQQAAFWEKYNENEKWVTKMRQLDVDLYREGRELGIQPQTTLEEINKKWLDELDRKTAFSERCCFRMPPKPTTCRKPGFFGFWGGLLSACLGLALSVILDD